MFERLYAVDVVTHMPQAGGEPTLEQVISAAARELESAGAVIEHRDPTQLTYHVSVRHQLAGYWGPRDIGLGYVRSGTLTFTQLAAGIRMHAELGLSHLLSGVGTTGALMLFGWLGLGPGALIGLGAAFTLFRISQVPVGARWGVEMLRHYVAQRLASPNGRGTGP